MALLKIQNSNFKTDRSDRSRLNPVSLDLVVKRLAADAEAFGRFQFVAVGFLEHLDEGIAFDTFKQRESGIGSFSRDELDVADGKVGDIDFRAFGQEDGALDFVLQLADVAGPFKTGQTFNGLRRETAQRAVGLGGVTAQK